MARRKKLKLKVKPDTINSLVAVALFAIGALVIVSFAGQGAFLGAINAWIVKYIGFTTVLVPFMFAIAGLVMMRVKLPWAQPNVLLGSLLFWLGMLGLFRTGTIGSALYANTASMLSALGAVIVFIAIAMSGALVMAQLTLQDVMTLWEHFASLPMWENIRLPKLAFLGKKDDTFDVNEPDQPDDLNLEEPELSEEDQDSEPAFSITKLHVADVEALQTGDTAETESNPAPVVSAPAPNGDAPAAPVVWKQPPLTLLSSKPGGKADRGDVKKNAAIIESTLESFGIRAKVVEVNYGPSVTQYALNISRGTKLSKITGLSTDLALALAAPTGQIRIEAPIAGKSLVGVEVPNHSAEFVTLRQMLVADTLKKHESKVAVSLGIDVNGKSVVADIAAMPHALIAGATGSGKSVAINAIMGSILFRASPDEVKFILVDPKRVELTGYNGIPHLLTPVIVEPSKVVSALKWATSEMDKRYKQLAEVGVKNIQSYNDLAGLSVMPNIVIIIDEMADVMMYSPSEVEESITRLAQMARAVGIHLVLATQRPSVDVITGLIKANVPTRMAFNVSSMQDSRVILDMPGAEKLLGKGDMLYIPRDQSKPTRVQGTFVSDKETKALVEFIKNQGYQPQYIEDVTSKFQADKVSGGSSGPGGEDRDDKFDDAVKLISQHDKASSSLIQRRLSVGYARAARILDQLHEAGLVGPPEGSKPREVDMNKIRDYLQTLQS